MLGNSDSGCFTQFTLSFAVFHFWRTMTWAFPVGFAISLGCPVSTLAGVPYIPGSPVFTAFKRTFLHLRSEGLIATSV
ncbi:hypothetical protein EI94DRAFT_219289 [Lactarius quietus]|nr:hypothetical protein EI94DRAFT_219289 [Lactarius quietus]